MTKEPTQKLEAMLFGNRFLTEDAAVGPFPPQGVAALDAYATGRRGTGSRATPSATWPPS